MRLLERNLLLLLIVAAGLLFASDYYELPWVTPVVLVGLGLIACLGGVRAITRGEVFEGRSRWGNPRFVARHTGISARLIGVALLIAGPVLVALGAMEISGPGGASIFLAGLPDAPYGWSAILGLTGAVITLMGIARGLSGSALPKGTWDRHVELSIRIGGAFFALAGLAMVSLAAWDLLAPGLLKGLADQLLDLLEHAARIAVSWALN